VGAAQQRFKPSLQRDPRKHGKKSENFTGKQNQQQIPFTSSSLLPYPAVVCTKPEYQYSQKLLGQQSQRFLSISLSIFAAGQQ
jgi:hypothetical protein